MAKNDKEGTMPWDVPWESKGEVTGGYGTQKLTQPSDGARADKAFAGGHAPAGDRSPTPPKEPGEARAPSGATRSPSGPVEATGAGERSSKLQAP